MGRRFGHPGRSGADGRLSRLRGAEPGPGAVLPGLRRPLPSRARPAGTRKAVTVVFSDLSGSTALGERLDPESLSRVMARYYEAMRAVVLHHGGTVEKFAGDAIMAVFGIPVAHEDDALRGSGRPPACTPPWPS
jgi:class 3 adenylate cyclase